MVLGALRFRAGPALLAGLGGVAHGWAGQPRSPTARLPVRARFINPRKGMCFTHPAVQPTSALIPCLDFQGMQLRESRTTLTSGGQTAGISPKAANEQTELLPLLGACRYLAIQPSSSKAGQNLAVRRPGRETQFAKVLARDRGSHTPPAINVLCEHRLGLTPRSRGPKGLDGKQGETIQVDGESAWRPRPPSLRLPRDCGSREQGLAQLPCELQAPIQ